MGLLSSIGGFFKQSINPKSFMRDFLFTGMPAAGLFTYLDSQKTQAKEDLKKGEIASAKAAHDAEVARLAENSLGAVAIRRRRGAYASMFTGTPALAAPSTGKTLLSQ